MAEAVAVRALSLEQVSLDGLLVESAITAITQDRLSNEAPVLLAAALIQRCDIKVCSLSLPGGSAAKFSGVIRSSTAIALVLGFVLQHPLRPVHLSSNPSALYSPILGPIPLVHVHLVSAQLCRAPPSTVHRFPAHRRPTHPRHVADVRVCTPPECR